MARLADKIALVTGGAGGIGAATAELFVEEGAAVALVDRDGSALDAVVAAIAGRQPDAKLLPLALDLGEEAACVAAVAQTVEHFGRLDVLVNNCGIRSYEPLVEAKAETWDRLLRINLLSYAYLTREALPHLRRAKGNVVNVSSTHANNPRGGMGQYDVAKAGIISLTKTTAFEEVEHGVRANCVCPGLTRTPFHVARAREAGRSDADMAADAPRFNIQNRWAEPREIAYPILWLASAEASFCTASVISADGGCRV